MKAKYSTKMDKEALSEGELGGRGACRDKSPDDPGQCTDYENDDFEEEEDPDDDFNLPKDHQQNDSSFGVQQLNNFKGLVEKKAKAQPASSGSRGHRG
jgi:hypothetical protein